MKKSIAKNRMAGGVAAFTLLALGMAQLIPTPPAKAQTGPVPIGPVPTDPGQEGDPQPNVEATATNTPCPTPHTSGIEWDKHASFSWECVEGEPTLVLKGGAYHKTRFNPCGVDQRENYTSQYVHLPPIPKERVVWPDSDDEYVETYYLYQLQEQGSDGYRGSVEETEMPEVCCIGVSP